MELRTSEGTGHRRKAWPLRVAIAGGALQGLELTYLANKAGFETLLLDRRSDAPASGICDRFVAIDLTDQEALTSALGSVDLVLPATENTGALQSLVEWCDRNRMPLAFDPDAYAITSSKKASNALFRRMRIPAPAPWPDCTFPVLAKPDGESGSRDVEVFPDLPALEARFGVLPPPGYVIQEYVSGPSYSIEVMGRTAGHTPLQVTDLEMDRDYDCKRVLAPSSLPPDLVGRFNEIAVTLAEAIALSGIMDVEVIYCEGRLLVLEIDARFPSQTPVAVYHSTGINMVEVLARLFAGQDEDVTGAGQAVSGPVPSGGLRGVVLEHIRVRGGELAVCGEHIMAGNGPLHLDTDFFGADEGLTNHAPGRDDWVATLMVGGSDIEDARERRDRVITEIRDQLDLKTYRDECPQQRFRQVS
jgi:pyrrolysine biosynthesis protein PylC